MLISPTARYERPVPCGKADNLDAFIDESGIKRYRLTKTQQLISEVLSADIGDAEDFSIVIFSFSTEQEKQRREARSLLQNYGFRLLLRTVIYGGGYGEKLSTEA